MLGPIDDKDIAGAFLSLEGADHGESEIPDAEQLWKACTGELSLEERLALVDQATACPFSALAFRVARELAREAQLEFEEDARAEKVAEKSSAAISLVESGGQYAVGPEFVVDPGFGYPKDDPQIHGHSTDNVEVLRPGRWQGKLRRTLAGCGVLAAAAAVALVVLKQEPKRNAGNWREHSRPGAMPVHKEGYSFSGGQFSWPSHEDSEHYELQLVDPSIKEICKVVVKTPSFAIDSSNCPGYSPGSAFFWRVRTVRMKGKESVSSYFSANAE